MASGMGGKLLLNHLLIAMFKTLITIFEKLSSVWDLRLLMKKKFLREN